MTRNDKKLTPDFRKNYFQIINNSLKTKIFKNFFVKDKKKKIDIVNNGRFACAWYASAVLLLSGLIDKTRLTVNSLEKDLLRNNWREVKKIKKGAILIWKEKENYGASNRHIGFYIGNNKAVSNNSQKGYPIIHHYTFGKDKNGPKRKIEKIYWHQKLDS
ncbi:MAG TPA: hypothetical protein ENN31_01865 [Candidatus Vogelbacteria bacterium]|nr:hypothetical protein [Candidatus Vogelbacteria bacterium]